MTPRKPPIVLTTDFGLKDEYAGVLKGVILSIDADATIIDLTHLISPQNIREAARIIGRNYRYFPDHSIHLCIVDPGVGSGRRILAVNAANQYFIGPDNGVFTPIFTSGTCIAVYEVTNEQWFLDNISNTFHGRDIMAPTAARLSLGESIESAGPPVSISTCVAISGPQPTVSPAGLNGVIDYIDRFGNLVTNISAEVLSAYAKQRQCDVVMDDRVMVLSGQGYADMADNIPAALVNSSGFIEICIKNGSAAQLLGAKVGNQILIRA